MFLPATPTRRTSAKAIFTLHANARKPRLLRDEVSENAVFREKDLIGRLVAETAYRTGGEVIGGACFSRTYCLSSGSTTLVISLGSEHQFWIASIGCR
jgi:hypothetical protein